MNRELLTRPFEPQQVKQRPGQHGKVLSYIDVAAVIARLNEACAAWSFEIVSHEVQDGEAIVLGKLTAEGVVKMAFGGSTITIDREGQVVSLADDFKSAASDALKKSASLLGVGLELYGGTAQPASHERQADAPGLASPAERITTRQLAAIHAASRRTGMSKEALGAMIWSRAGKNDVAQLSKSEASSVISELTGTNGGGR